MTIITALPGADNLLSFAHHSVDRDAMNGDQEIEIDNFNSVLEAERTMAPELLLDDTETNSSEVPQASKKSKTNNQIDARRVDELIQEKSRDVVVVHTQQEYARYIVFYKKNFYQGLRVFWSQIDTGISSLNFVQMWAL